MSHFYLKPVGGLANRIRVINSGLAFARQRKLDLTVIWEMNSDLNSSYQKLFEPNKHFEIIEIQPGVNFVGNHLHYYPDKRPNGWRNFLFSTLNTSISSGSAIWYDQLSTIYDGLKSQYDPDQIASQKELTKRTLLKIDELLGKALNAKGDIFLASSWSINDSELSLKLEPNSELKKKIDAIDINEEKTIGVHIRRTDHTWSTEHSTLNKFIDLMQLEVENNDNVNFFVASDDDKTIDTLMEKFPDRIKTINHQTMDRNSHEGIETAVIDLFCLARCQSIIGSYLSSFSDLSAQIGPNKIKYAV